MSWAFVLLVALLFVAREVDSRTHCFDPEQGPIPCPPILYIESPAFKHSPQYSNTPRYLSSPQGKSGNPPVHSPEGKFRTSPEGQFLDTPRGQQWNSPKYMASP
eukprot:Sspe_Gene.79228::Locus_49651_Transcript_1_1_Confidence_1.000_Length_352::g.79228::m.79228